MRRTDFQPQPKNKSAMPPIKRTRALTYVLFETRFHPIVRADGSILWSLGELNEAMRCPYRHWWTLLDCGGRLYLSAGFHYVNRLNFVCCEVPWTDADQLTDYRYG
jgi:hypothetical protein